MDHMGEIKEPIARALCSVSQLAQLSEILFSLDELIFETSAEKINNFDIWVQGLTITIKVYLMNIILTQTIQVKAFKDKLMSIYLFWSQQLPQELFI